MEKRKKILIISLPIVIVLLTIISVLHAFKVVPIWLFCVFFPILLTLVALNVIFLVLIIKKIKKLKNDKLKTSTITSSGDYMTDLYGILGIPIQYHEDGRVKDIYELIGIVPEYDEDGKRLRTIYELLGILPKFDKNGQEIPSVVVVKNGIRRVAKVDLSSRVLTRKLTEQEKEDLLIKETLRKKLDEATQTGDKGKVEVIKKAINEVKKSSEKKDDSGKTRSKIKIGSNGKAVSSNSFKYGDVLKGVAKASVVDLMTVFAKINEVEKNKAPKIEPKKQEGQIKSEPVIEKVPKVTPAGGAISENNNKGKNRFRVSGGGFVVDNSKNNNRLGIDIDNSDMELGR